MRLGPEGRSASPRHRSPDQFYDRTKAGVSTFFGNGIVAHVSFGDPLCHVLADVVEASGKDAGVPVKRGGTYVCMEGPQFSTRAESNTYRSWGMDLIGMTNLQEAKLAREAEICYTTMALVTDYDCWHPDHDSVTVADIVRNLHKNSENAQKIIKAAVKRLPVERTCKCGSALASRRTHGFEEGASGNQGEARNPSEEVPVSVPSESIRRQTLRSSLGLEVRRLFGDPHRPLRDHGHRCRAVS